jgi:hypothetical protein
MRIYDPRLGRFLSVDPLTLSYPFYTPYQFAGNKPIWAVDLDGAEELLSNEAKPDGTVLRVYGWPDGLRRELDYPNGAMATHIDGDSYWRYSRMNEYGRSQLYRSKGQGWELYKDEEALYRTSLTSADRFRNIMTALVVAPVVIGAGIEGGIIVGTQAALGKGLLGGGSDLAVQLAANKGDINQVNWTSVAANVALPNAVLSAGVGSAFEVKQEDIVKGKVGANTILEDKTLSKVITETAVGAVGNTIGGHTSDYMSIGRPVQDAIGTFIGNSVGNVTSTVVGGALPKKEEKQEPK